LLQVAVAEVVTYVTDDIGQLGLDLEDFLRRRRALSRNTYTGLLPG
jgi:hypothetical protein